MKYIRSSTSDTRGFAEYVQRLNDDLYHYSMSAEGTSPDNLRIIPYGDVLEGVQIDLTIEVENDGENYRYYFMPVVTLPVLDSAELNYADSVHYYLKEYADKIGNFVKFMIGNPFVEGMYDTYFEELDYEE